MKRLSALFSYASIVFCGLAAPHLAAGASAYTLTPSSYGMQLRTPDGRIVFEYLTKKPEDIGLTSPSAACFHPVNTPSGERITSIAPDDHPHHRGIFLAWHDSEFRSPVDLSKYGARRPLNPVTVSRADFWAWGQYAPREGRVIQNREVKLVRADSAHAELEIYNDWLINRRKMLDEADSVAVTERDGVYVIDLDYRLTPVVDFVINRMAFSGFAVQCRKDGESYYSTAAGKAALPPSHYCCPELNWPSEPWYDYTIRLNQNGKILGVTVLDHPQNPPTSWFNEVWMLQPTIAGFGPITVSQGKTLRLRYRVVVHDGATPTGLLQKLSAEWGGPR
jgi:Methane oxygenase PmoA